MSKTTISVFEFFQTYPDNESARIYIESRRWGKGAECPHCQSISKSTKRKDNDVYICRLCRKTFSVRTGTIFQDSKLPLNKWLYAIYLVVVSRKGISSLRLAKELGITQKSAWFLLHRIREACVDNNLKLSGEVKIDEVFTGGKEKNKPKHKRIRPITGTTGKQPVIGMRERGGNIIAQPVVTTGSRALQPVVREKGLKGSKIFTDENRAYKGLQDEYIHQAVNYSAWEYVKGEVHTNGIESAWALLKRGIYGTFHQISNKHLQRYLNEFAFRLNEGNVKNHVYNRIESVIEGSFGKTLQYKVLIK